jgi:hypothetical protein
MLEIYPNTFDGEKVRFLDSKTEEQQLETWTCPFFNRAKDKASKDTYEFYSCKGPQCQVEVQLDGGYHNYYVRNQCINSSGREDK